MAGPEVVICLSFMALKLLFKKVAETMAVLLQLGKITELATPKTRSAKNSLI